MLPSFRLIAATFLCGFFVVFAGLRLATSLNNIHEALPVLTVHAAPLTGAGARNPHGAPVAVPMLYDLRFVASTATIAPLSASVDPHAIDRAAPIVPPLVVEDVTKAPRPAADVTKAETDTPKRDGAVAAVQPEAPVSPVPAEPQSAAAAPPEPFELERPQPPAVAAVDPLATPSPEAPNTAAVEPAAEPSAVAAPVEPSTAPAAAHAAVEPQATSSATEKAAAEPAVTPSADPAAAASQATSATNTAAVEPSVTPAPDAGPPEPPAPVTAAVEPPAAPPPEIATAEPLAIGTVESTVADLDRGESAATEVPLPRPPAARPALRAKAKLVHRKRTAAKDGFGDPFGNSFGNWPK